MKSPGLDEIECLAVLKTDDGFFPVCSAACISATVALALAAAVERADRCNLLSKKLFDSTLHFEFVRIAVHLETRIRCFAPVGGWLSH